MSAHQGFFMTMFAINGIEGGIYDYDYDDGAIIIIAINDYDYDYDDDDDVNCHYNINQHNTIIIIFPAFSSTLSE